MEATENTQETPISYFEKRCQLIGLTPENNKLKIKEHPAMPNSKYLEFPLLSEDKKTGNIVIPLYDLSGQPLNYYKDNPGKLQNGKAKPVEIIRYSEENYARFYEQAEKEGKDAPPKYLMPKGAKTWPWISPNIIYDYAKQKKISTIIITEGYIKGISGYLNDLHIFALSGILNYKDKDTGALHTDILEVIQTCKVENIILLYDGDCNQISLKALGAEKDLYKRPANFYNSAKGIKDLLKDLQGKQHFDIYFAHIDSKSLEGNPKGLDDVYSAFETDKPAITKELLSFSKQKPFYFTKLNITVGVYPVLAHLHINTHEVFYNYHQEHIKDKPFVFHGTKYQWDADKKILKIVKPGAAKLFIRVGDDYFEKIMVPNEIGKLEFRLAKRSKSTITDDHGKKIIEHIDKYKAFCVKPDHENYQEIIDGCYNSYKKFEHGASTEQDCQQTIDFVKHIFGEQLELGLDYIQLLYQKPTEKLPILSLVSKENNTGKSTFLEYLKVIFTGNMAIIGNDQLEKSFNASWADKLIVACEESFIEKKKTVEKIKALSTGKRIEMERKGVDGEEVAFFAKFILCSNNETNFTIANENDQRYWVVKVKPIEKLNPNLMHELIEEVPNFLCFLNNRNLSVPVKESRMWFKFDRIKTEAFIKLVEANQTGAERELKSILRDLFIDTGCFVLHFTLKYIAETLLRNKYERNYIERVLKDKFTFTTNKQTTRFQFPEIIKKHENNTTTDEIIISKGIGKPYIFSANAYLTPEQIEEFKHSDVSLKNGFDGVTRNSETQLLINGINTDDGTDMPF